jgi:hypothetical protein
MKITKRNRRKLQKQQDDPRYHGYTHMMMWKDKPTKYGALTPTEDGWMSMVNINKNIDENLVTVFEEYIRI